MRKNSEETAGKKDEGMKRGRMESKTMKRKEG